MAVDADSLSLQSSVPEYYVDASRFTLNPFSLGIEFGVLAFPSTGTSSTSEVTPLVRVRMSPQHAYAMRELLSNNIAAYEEQIGKINLPNQFVSLGNEAPD